MNRAYLATKPLWAVRRTATHVALLCLAGMLAGNPLLAQTNLASDRAAFAHPPDDTRIMVRWWWFGPAVTKPELLLELQQMKSMGIGGVEIATLYPQALDDPSTGFHNVPYLSDEYIDDLHFAATQARQLGLRVDVTLCSGWPFGGPHIPITQAAGELRVERVAVVAGASSITVPSLEPGEQFLRAFVVTGDDPANEYSAAQAAETIQDGRLNLGPAGSARTAVFFIASRTGMMVKRPAVGAAGFVLDHYDKRAMETHLGAVGDRLLQAFEDNPPYAVFSDSLEDYASDWTPDLLAQFKQRRGYDLTPYLPALVGDIGPSTAAIRHDWGRTLTELANENFLAPMHTWATQHHTLLRSQTYGYPPVTLSSNRYEDLPEGEGKATIEMWRQFSDTRWAASAGHLFGHNVISSETWTWLHSPAFRATPLDMKAEADLHFLQGINQLIGHGWPYSPAEAGEPGWRMYAATALNDHNPWNGVMPDLTGYLQHVSYALRLGRPANDVAVLLPNDDIWASFKARVDQNKPTTSAFGFDESHSNVTIDESMNEFLDKRVIPQILDAGFNIDFTDADSIDTVGIPYKVLVLPNIDRLPAETYRKILAFAQHGGIVVATGRMPATAPGFLHLKEESQQVQEISRTLFEGRVKSARLLASPDGLGDSIASSLEPDVVLSPRTPAVGFIHRRLGAGDLYFLANTSNKVQQVQAHFRVTAKYAEQWDPFSGEVHALSAAQNLTVNLQPYESRIFVFSNDAPTAGIEPVQTVSSTVDLSHDWKVRFPTGDSLSMRDLRSWTGDENLSYFSGTAAYEKTINLPAAAVRRGSFALLDFGKGTPVAEPDPLPRFNMRAYLDAPIRDTAQVFVNGHLAGDVWYPPYQVDISSFLNAGENHLKILVSNTAINELSGKSQPTYRLLYDKYGTLFSPQDMDHLQPLPSGILGTIILREGSLLPVSQQR